MISEKIAARKGAKWTYPKPDYSEVVATAKGQPTLRLASSLRIGLEGRTAQARTKMKRDEVHYVALAFSDLPPPVDTAQAEDVTKAYTTAAKESDKAIKVATAELTKAEADLLKLVPTVAPTVTASAAPAGEKAVPTETA